MGIIDPLQFSTRIARPLHPKYTSITFKCNIRQVLDKLGSIDMEHLRTESRDSATPIQMHIVESSCKGIDGIAYEV